MPTPLPVTGATARRHGQTLALLVSAALLAAACLDGEAAPGSKPPSPDASSAPSVPPKPNVSPTPAPTPGLPTLTVNAEQHLLHERTFKPVFASVSVRPGYYTVALDSTLMSGGRRVNQVIAYSASPYDSSGWFHVLTHDQPVKLHISDGTLHAGLIGLTLDGGGGTATVSVYDDDGLPLGHAVIEGQRYVVKLDSFQPASLGVTGGSYQVGLRTSLAYGSPATAVPKTLVIVPDSHEATGWYHLAYPGAGIHVPATTLYATSLAPDTGAAGSAELTLRRQ